MRAQFVAQERLVKGETLKNANVSDVACCSGWRCLQRLALSAAPSAGCSENLFFSRVIKQRLQQSDADALYRVRAHAVSNDTEVEHGPAE
jgi:hypothetical protein